MFAVVYIPQFSLQAVLRHEPELWKTPLGLVDPAGRPVVIAEMTEPAAAAGVTPGLTPTQAMARCGSIVIRPRSAEQEQAAAAALLQCAYAFSPHLEATGPGVCTLDLRGLALLAGGDKAALEKWGGQLQRSVAGLQLSAAVGLGPTPDVACHGARWGKDVEVVEEPRAFIAALPLAALEPSPDAALIIQRWGIRTVGEWIALGQEGLSARLGLEGLALLAAASSTGLRPLRLVQPPETFEESFEFNESVETIEPLLFLLRRFVDQLAQRLAPRGFVADALLLKLGLESGETLTCRLRLPQPTRAPDVLFRTLHTHLESVRTESAIKTVALAVIPTHAQEKQLGLFETVLADPEQFQETLARLAAVLGPDRVGSPILEDSHRPDAFRLASPDFENAPAPASNPRPGPVQMIPLRRFRPPIRAEVETGACSESTTPRAGASSRPVSIRCSVAKGKLRIVMGPWRASGQWWESNAWQREEWDASTVEGQVIRLVHQLEGWFVEGVVD